MIRPKHHIRQQVCATRAPYREGRKPTAVKVYAIHQESKYLLVQGVPAVGASQELVRLFEAQGEIEEHKILDDYPSEHFTETHLIKYKRIQSARFAKKKFDDWSFYGGVLHLCYVPEYETVQETREKLQERQRVILAKTKQYKSDGTYDLYKSQKGEGQRNIEQTREMHQTVGHAENDYLSVSHTPGLSDTSYTLKPPAQDINTFVYSEEGRTDSTGSTAGHNTDTHQLYVLQPYSAQRSSQLAGDNFIEPGQPHDYSVQNIQETASFPNKYNGVPKQQGKPRTLAVQQAHAMHIYGNMQKDIDKDNKKLAKTFPEQRVERTDEAVVKGTAAVDETRNDKDIPGGKVSADRNRKRTNMTEVKEEIGENKQEILILPPPPKQRKTCFSATTSYKFSHAKVPSAQAGFPADFDARIWKPPIPNKPNSSDKADLDDKVNVNQELPVSKSDPCTVSKRALVTNFVPRQIKS